MIFAGFGTGQVLWSALWISVFVVWFWLLIAIVADAFRDDDLSAWAKAGWVVFVLVVPFPGILVYLIARGKGMPARAVVSAKAHQDAMDEDVRQTAASADPAAPIEKAERLLDSGTITQDVCDALRAKALA